MRRLAFSLGSLGAVILTAVATGASVRAQPATGRALVDVRTPPLPTSNRPSAGRRRRDAIERSADRLTAVARRNALGVKARSVPGGFLAVGLRGEPIAALRAQLSEDPLVT